MCLCTNAQSNSPKAWFDAHLLKKKVMACKAVMCFCTSAQSNAPKAWFDAQLLKKVVITWACSKTIFGSI